MVGFLIGHSSSINTETILFSENLEYITDLLQLADEYAFPAAVSSVRLAVNSKRFFKRWLANPLQIGSIVPSSAALCRRIVQQILLEKDELILRLGVGIRVTSRALWEGLRRTVYMC